ncbi:MAG: hypothetical protein ACM32E_04980 [Gemmatimonadota bacterium]
MPVPPGRRRALTKPWPAAVAAALCLSLLAAACTPAAHPRASRAGAAASPPPATAALVLQVTPAAYQLPSGVSREVVLAAGRRLLIAGGLTPSSASSAAVRSLNPVTGDAARAGRLAAPTHDAAGAVLGGRAYLFGGGDQASAASVQSLAARGRAALAGRLPRPRSDLSAVTIGGTGYLLGGYDGASYDASVLATRDGRHFRQVAKLPVPVRYAAVAAAGGQIWVFGGQSASGLTSDIQRVSPATGAASVAGHLPRPVTGAAALALGGLIYVAGGQVAPARGGSAASAAALTTTGAVLAFDPGRGTMTPAGQLPVPVANAGAAVLGRTGYLVGGNNGQRQVPTVTTLRLVTPAAALPPAGDSGATVPLQADAATVIPRSGPAARSGHRVPGAGGGRGGGAAPAAVSGTGSSILASAPWLGPAHGHGHLAPHSDPSVLPGDILIADNWNNRLLIVDPHGRIRWRFPRPGDLRHGQSFRLPDDAFFSPDGKSIVATEEEDSVISVISIARHRISYRYGTPGAAGSGYDQVANPDDAMMMPGGRLITADIENCRLLVLRPPSHRPRRIIGQTGTCGHNPPASFGSPNGAFPATNGRYIVTEINGDWANEMSLRGHVYWSVHPPGVSYPSDTNEVYPGRYLTADYSSPGQVVEFNSRGRLLWRFGGLNHPSLAQPLPNGDILVNDDYNDRVIVIDPTTNKIVWQYGHTGVPGTRPGYLNDPDGIDLTPPNSMLIAHAATMGRP